MENSSFIPPSDSLFKKLEHVLKEKAPQLKENFAAGLSAEYLKNMLAKNKLDAPELVNLYSWNNGLAEGLNYYILKYNICSFGKILPFNSALSLYLASTMEPDSMWKKTLFRSPPGVFPGRLCEEGDPGIHKIKTPTAFTSSLSPVTNRCNYCNYLGYNL